MAMANGIKKDVPSFSEANKKNESEMKRMESMKKKRQEFKQKQMIIKTGLIGIVSTFLLKIYFFCSAFMGEELVTYYCVLS